MSATNACDASESTSPPTNALRSSPSFCTRRICESIALPSRWPSCFSAPPRTTSYSARPEPSPPPPPPSPRASCFVTDRGFFVASALATAEVLVRSTSFAGPPSLPALPPPLRTRSNCDLHPPSSVSSSSARRRTTFFSVWSYCARMRASRSPGTFLLRARRQYAIASPRSFASFASASSAARTTVSSTFPISPRTEAPTSPASSCSSYRATIASTSASVSAMASCKDTWWRRCHRVAASTVIESDSTTWAPDGVRTIRDRSAATPSS